MPTGPLGRAGRCCCGDPDCVDYCFSTDCENFDILRGGGAERSLLGELGFSSGETPTQRQIVDRIRELGLEAHLSCCRCNEVPNSNSAAYRAGEGAPLPGPELVNEFPFETGLGVDTVTKMATIPWWTTNRIVWESTTRSRYVFGQREDQFNRGSGQEFSALLTANSSIESSLHGLVSPQGNDRLSVELSGIVQDRSQQTVDENPDLGFEAGRFASVIYSAEGESRELYREEPGPWPVPFSDVELSNTIRAEYNLSYDAINNHWQFVETITRSITANGNTVQLPLERRSFNSLGTSDRLTRCKTFAFELPRAGALGSAFSTNYVLAEFENRQTLVKYG